MSNMSYCRFQNTRADLAACVDALMDGEPLSKEEARAAERMAELCADYLDHYSYGVTVEGEEED